MAPVATVVAVVSVCAAVAVWIIMSKDVGGGKAGGFEGMMDVPSPVRERNDDHVTNDSDSAHKHEHGTIKDEKVEREIMQPCTGDSSFGPLLRTTFLPQCAPTPVEEEENEEEVAEEVEAEYSLDHVLGDEGYANLRRSRRFDSRVRAWLLALIVFLILYVPTHFLLLRLLYLRDPHGLPAQEVDRFAIPFFLCTVSLNVSLCVLLLLGSTIARGIPIGPVRNPEESIVDGVMMQILWDLSFWSCNVSFFFLTPFAYFYYEAEGFKRLKGPIGRAVETLIVVLLFIGLMLGSFFLIRSLLGVTARYLPSFNSLLAIIGALLCLVSAPVGFTRAIAFSFSLRTPWALWIGLQDSLQAWDIEEAALRRRLSELSQQTSVFQFSALYSSKSSEIAALRTQLSALQTRRSDAMGIVAWHPLLRNTLSFVLTVFALTLACLVIVRVAFQRFLGPGVFDYDVFLPSGWDATLTPFLDILVVFFFFLTSLVGLYETRLLFNAAPRPGGTRLQLLLLNTAIVLIFSSSLPLVARLLGLLQFDLVHFSLDFIRNDMVIKTYNSAFLISTLFAAVYRGWRRSL